MASMPWGRTVLREVSFSLAADEVVALVGRSGAGKTTLLYLAAGLCRPSKGRILFDGRELDSRKPGRIKPVAPPPDRLGFSE